MVNFPAALDDFTNPDANDALGITGPKKHSTQHAQANDAIEALEAKVGIDGSADTTSLDYKAAQAADHANAAAPHSGHETPAGATTKANAAQAAAEATAASDATTKADAAQAAAEATAAAALEAHDLDTTNVHGIADTSTLETTSGAQTKANAAQAAAEATAASDATTKADAAQAAAEATAAGLITARRYSESIGDGAATTITVTHNLGTRDVIVALRETASPYGFVQATVEAATINTVTVTFATAPTANQYRITIIS
jgi:hypothetical protein